MSTIGELAVNAVVRTEGATKGTREFKTEVRGMSDAATAAGAGVALLGAMALTAGYKIYSLVEQQGKVADALEHTTQKTGLSVENLSRYQYGAKMAAEVGADGLSSAMERMNTNTGMAAHGLGRAGKAIEELGLDAKHLSSLDTDTRLMVYAEAIKRVGNAADQTRLTEKIFGDGNLMLMLKDGAAGLNKLSEEADRTGATLGTGANKQLAEADDALDRMHASTAGAKHALASVFAPAITEVAGELTDTIALLRGQDLALHASEEAHKREAAAVKASAEARKKWIEVQWAKGASSVNTVDMAYRKQELSGMDRGRESLEERIRSMREGNETFGMSDVDAARKHRQSGTSGFRDNALEDQLIKELEARERLTQAQKDNAEAQQRDNDLKERATQLIEQQKSPLDHFKDQLAEINDLRQKGKLTEEQAQKAVEAARKGVESAADSGAKTTQRQGLASIKFGSAEAARAIHESRGGDEVKQISRKSLKELEEANRLAAEQNRIMEAKQSVIAAWG